MAMIWYGTKVFTKFQGYYGDRTECPYCHSVYRDAYVKYTTWAHLYEIPIFPIKVRYYKMCPVCGNGVELNKGQAKNEMLSVGQTDQRLEAYSRHILAGKPKGILAVDNSYEFWVRDTMSGGEVCIATGLTKDAIKEMKKRRGLKEFKIIDM
ncbi:zinc-ribbon domain-containing protein [Candidatus Saccharibacteria bacterium]|nr:zinc-ribbon domain-containing protein [Candidatus Saccharibacteria bacterium]